MEAVLFLAAVLPLSANADKVGHRKTAQWARSGSKQRARHVHAQLAGCQEMCAGPGRAHTHTTQTHTVYF